MSRYFNDHAVHSSSDDEDYVAHHGVLGMKWGIRRYQNKDGSLTPKGKARLYGKDGTEPLEHRLDRAIDAAKYDYDISDVHKKLSMKYGKMHEKADREPVIYITRDAFGRPMYSAAMDDNYLKAMKKLQSAAESEYKVKHGKARR